MHAKALLDSVLGPTAALDNNIQLLHGGQTHVGPRRHKHQALKVQYKLLSRYFTATAARSSSFHNAVKKLGSKGLCRESYAYTLAKEGLLVRPFADPSPPQAFGGR